MRNAFLVALREYVENAKTKGFWIGIFMLPVVLFLSIQVPMLLERKGAPVRQFVLIDFTGQYDQILDREFERQYQRRMLSYLNEYAREHRVGLPDTLRPIGLETSDSLDRFIELGGKKFYLDTITPLLPPAAPEFVEPRRLYRRVPLPFATPADPAEAAQRLRPALAGEETFQQEGQPVRLDAAIIIATNLPDQASPSGTASSNLVLQYWSSNLADKSLRTIAENAINQELRRREYTRRGLDPKSFAEVESTRIPVLDLNPKKEEGQERVSKAESLAQWAPVAFVYLLWVALFSISQMLLTNTIEEKSNRIIEVLLSSVTPAEFVIGKLAGIAAVGLTTIGAWLGSFLFILAWKSSGQSEVATQFASLLQGSHLLPAFVVYFFFGYLLYAGIILAIGSVCNTLKEAQNYMGVITMLMMVPLLTMMFIPKDPNGTVATVLSWIPIYTPFIMMNRAAASPPMFDVIGTMVLLVLSTIFVLWAAVKIFRLGILRTGQPPRLLEMIRWLRAK
ncbi:MAG TPA: ABC transporter permease [Candidatus Kapabacteria bacterium]|nr:ABC transporter permease [Candidatus Kapabacteria bacterium]